MFKKNDDFNSFSIAEFLTRPFKKTGRWLAGVLDRDDSIHTQRSFSSQLVNGLSFPLRYLWGWVYFLMFSWTITRQLIPFLKGATAVLVAAGFLFAIWVINSYGHNRQLGMSLNRVQHYLETDPVELEPAIEFVQKAIQLEPDNNQLKQKSAELLFKAGKPAQALDIANHIAPRDQPGYAPSHVWLSRYWLTKSMETAVTGNQEEAIEQRRIAFQHASQVVETHGEEYRDVINWNIPQEQVQIVKALREAYILSAQVQKQEALRYEVDSDLWRENMESAVANFELGITKRIIMWQQLSAVPELINALVELDRTDDAYRKLEFAFQSLKMRLQQYPDETGNTFIWAVIVENAINLDDYELAYKMLDQAMGLTAKPEDVKELARLKVNTKLRQSNKYADWRNFPTFVIS